MKFIRILFHLMKNKLKVTRILKKYKKSIKNFNNL